VARRTTRRELELNKRIRPSRPYHRRTTVYYDARWRKARLRFLEANPLCVECKRHNYLVAATEVDHIRPHKGNHELFWDETNWQSLCNKHHSAKTLRTIQETARGRPVLQRGADVNGIPLDPRHPWNQR
jgi:5-methylcytosine-specific restriction enzyme A